MSNDFDPGIHLCYLADVNTSVAEVQYAGTTTEEILTATGSSRRARGDKKIPAVAEDLAVARALRNLAQKLENRANARLDKEYPEEVTEQVKPGELFDWQKAYQEYLKYTPPTYGYPWGLSSGLSFHRKPPYDPPVDA